MTGPRAISRVNASAPPKVRAHLHAKRPHVRADRHQERVGGGGLLRGGGQSLHARRAAVDLGQEREVWWEDKFSWRSFMPVNPSTAFRWEALPEASRQWRWTVALPLSIATVHRHIFPWQRSASPLPLTAAPPHRARTWSRKGQ